MTPDTDEVVGEWSRSLSTGSSALLAEIPAVTLRAPSGAELFRQGDPADRAVVVMEGFVKLTRDSESGRTLVLSFGGPGAYYGIDGMMTDGRYAASGWSMTPCHLRVIQQAALLDAVGKDTALASELLRHVSWQLLERTIQASALCHSDSTERLRRLLMALVPRAAPTRLPLPLKQHELASAIGVTREHLSKLLRTLEQGGLVKRDRGRIVVLPPSSAAPAGTRGASAVAARSLGASVPALPIVGIG